MNTTVSLRSTTHTTASPPSPALTHSRRLRVKTNNPHALWPESPESSPQISPSATPRPVATRIHPSQKVIQTSSFATHLRIRAHTVFKRRERRRRPRHVARRIPVRRGRLALRPAGFSTATATFGRRSPTVCIAAAGIDDDDAMFVPHVVRRRALRRPAALCGSTCLPVFVCTNSYVVCDPRCAERARHLRRRRKTTEDGMASEPDAVVSALAQGNVGSRDFAMSLGRSADSWRDYSRSNKGTASLVVSEEEGSVVSRS